MMIAGPQLDMIANELSRIATLLEPLAKACEAYLRDIAYVKGLETQATEFRGFDLGFDPAKMIVPSDPGKQSELESELGRLVLRAYREAWYTAATSVQTDHWNNAADMVNAKEQAFRSAHALRCEAEKTNLSPGIRGDCDAFLRKWSGVVQKHGG